MWRARQERDSALSRARQLAAALAAHGLAPPPRRLASAAALLAAGPRDATRPRTLRAPADLLPELDRPLSCGDLSSRSIHIFLYHKKANKQMALLMDIYYHRLLTPTDTFTYTLFVWWGRNHMQHLAVILKPADVFRKISHWRPICDHCIFI